MSPAEAVSRVNESVVVEMVVRRTKCCTGSRQAFLDPEPDHRDPKNLASSSPRTGGRGSVRRGSTTRPHTTRARPSGFVGW